MDTIVGLTAIITGAAGGIGPFIARALARERMNLVLVDTSEMELEHLTTELRAEGIIVMSVPADVTDMAAMEKIFSDVQRTFSSLDVLVNNAGIETVLPYHRIESEMIERVIYVNLLAPMLLTRLIIPIMLSQRRGHIVNIASLAGKGIFPYLEPYVASKAGLIGFTKSLRAQYHCSGISASVICPGFVRQAGMYHRHAQQLGTSSSHHRSTSSPEEVGQAVVHAIKKDIPEILVNPVHLIMKFFFLLCDLSPSLGQWVATRFASARATQRIAQLQQSRKE